MEKVNVKILGISCHHRRARNTAWLTLFALKAVEKFGKRISEVANIETEFIDLRERTKRVPSQSACRKADDHYESEEEDYILSELIPKMAEADGFIFGSPVYTGSYTSKFITMCERLRVGVKHGYYSDKPAGCVSVATMPMGGQDRCLEAMEICTRALGMMPVHPLFGCSGTSGVPYGPICGDDDGTVIAVKNDRFAQWTSILVGRRVAEVAVMRKLARRRLGDLYRQEMIQRYTLPFGNESWAWTDLDEQDRQFMDGLNREDLKQLDGRIFKHSKPAGGNGLTCKIVGFGCDDSHGGDADWLIINSLKAVEKFGRRLGSVANFDCEYVDLTDKKIRACLNCDKYPDMPHGGKRWKGAEYPGRDTYGCILKDDYFNQEVLTRYAEADGLILGSDVVALTPSITFRLFAERVVTGIWTGWNNLKPIANIAVSYDNEGGQESCLNIMNTCNRWNESLPVSWPHGTPASGSAGSKEITVKNDARARLLSVVNGRRVAEFALMKRLAKEELGEVYKREFYFVIHPPHGDAAWEWSRLDEAEHQFMMDLSPKELSRLGS
jgi:multimeric flavodoxin WrbA